MQLPSRLRANLPTFQRRWRNQGFTLVEVVLAIGILSFAVIPMMTLIVGSLDSYRNAITDTVARQIMTQLATNAQQAPLEDLESTPQDVLYFDFEGNPVAENDPMRIYTATVVHEPLQPLYPSNNLFRVQITVHGMDVNDQHHTSLQVFAQPGPETADE